MASPSSSTVTGPSAVLSALRRRGSRFLLWRGIVGVLSGLLLVLFPFSSAVAMSIVVGAWMVVDGLVASGQAVDLRKAGMPWGRTLAEGIVAVLAGVAVLLLPGVFAVVGSFFIIGFLAVGLVVSGVTQLSVPRELRDGWAIASGVLNVVFGVLLGVLAVLNPVDNVWTLAWVAGVYALVLGVSAIAISLRLRRSGTPEE
ncbi:DUF308 domain-containing protein [Corynebacterium sp.]|uniref:HdeD family acid-resistance protein n=1 Tax=Corynebacterium sp. TaxID=1720 RepID=UPI0025BBF2B2|nr:DUF308 domain-containing protein [Corynebacterium sp.]